MPEPIENFVTIAKSFRGTERPVLASQNEGPPVILLHEIFGMSVTVAAFAQMIRAAGFRVYMPVLFGSTHPKDGPAEKALGMAEFACVARQFRIFSADEPGPWADWLRDLVDWACVESGHARAGVIGLCLTGNFALSMAANPRVGAAVMGEPSLPMVGEGLHVSSVELADVKANITHGLEVRGYRYSTDRMCRASLFERLAAELGAGFKGETLQVQETLHSVFTEHLRDSQGRLRHSKVQEVIEFFGRLRNP
jgi:dienelactone hydrolase